MGNVIGFIVVALTIFGFGALLIWAINSSDNNNRRKDQICYPLARSGEYTDRLTHKERVVCALPDGGVEVK